MSKTTAAKKVQTTAENALLVEIPYWDGEIEVPSPEKLGLMRPKYISAYCSVQNGTFQGDPGNGNAPRIDPDMHEWVSNGGLKRYLRDAVLEMAQLAGKVDKGLALYFDNGAILDNQISSVAARLGLSMNDKLTPIQLKQIAEAACRCYWDARAFGASFMSPFPAIRGPVQVDDASSVETTSWQPGMLTRKSVQSAERSESMNGFNGELGTRHRSRFTLFRMNITVSPQRARDTGFNSADYKVLLKAIRNMFQTASNSQSSTRGLRTVHHIIEFERNEIYGLQPKMIFPLVQLIRKDPDQYPTDWSDYTLSVKPLPHGITVRDIPLTGPIP